MSFAREHKRFRRFLRRFDLVESLFDVWRYSLHVIERQPLAAGYAVGMPASLAPVAEHVYPWELGILARELVLNAGSHEHRSLRQWRHLADAVNFVRRLDEATIFGPDEILLELHRIAHRQFPWQTNVGVGPMARTLKVFGATAVDAIVMRELGMTANQFLTLGMAVGGSFMRSPGLSTKGEYECLGIPRVVIDAFFRRITCTLEQLRSDLVKLQSHDRDWLYTWNPLEATPLVSIDPVYPERLICPIPRYLLRRVSGGLFYDLVKAKDFDNPFGDAFQAYVGDVLKATCEPPRFTILGEEPYRVRREKLHGVDWVLSDSTGHLFIESKTKRLTIKAKALTDMAALEADLVVMATAIVQHYRNIGDALAGRTKWLPDGLPVYPLVLTLEEWFLFSPQVDQMLDGHVRRLLAEAGLSEEVLKTMPYTIASAHEFEIASQVIAQAGVGVVMGKRLAPDRPSWSLLAIIDTDFKQELDRVNPALFADDLSKLVPQRPAA